MTRLRRAVIVVLACLAGFALGAVGWLAFDAFAPIHVSRPDALAIVLMLGLPIAFGVAAWDLSKPR